MIFLWRWWKARTTDPYGELNHSAPVVRSAHMSNATDPFRATQWQPSTLDTNTNWVPQFQPTTWQRPLSLVYKQEKALRGSSDTIVPPWVKVKTAHISRPSLSSSVNSFDREPVSNYKYSSKAALPPPPAAYVVGRAAMPMTPVIETNIRKPEPIPVPTPTSPSPRYTTIMEAEASRSRHTSIAACRPSEDTLVMPEDEEVPPVPQIKKKLMEAEAGFRARLESEKGEQQETLSAEGQEFEIPDFQYAVPKTPRLSSLPKHYSGPASGADVPPEHFFPPTPASVAERYGYATPRTPAGVFVSPMASTTSSRFTTHDNSPIPPLPSPSINLPRLVKVIGTYQPVLADELAVGLGETLRLLHVFPDEWCLVQRLFPNETSAVPSRTTTFMESGAVPILCLSEIGGGSIPRAPPSNSPIEPVASVSVAHPDSASPSSNSPSAASETSGVSGISGQTGTTNTTTTTTISEPRSHWSSATTNIDALSPITSPGSDRSQVLLAKKNRHPASPASASSSVSGQSLVIPPGLSGAGYMPRMPKKLSQVTRPLQTKSTTSVPVAIIRGPVRPYAAPAGMTMKNGSFSSMFDRSRAS